MIIFNLHKYGRSIDEICKITDMEESVVKSIITIEEKQVYCSLSKI